MDVRDLMKGAIDIHIHIPPDPNFRRRLNAYEVVTQAKEAGMRGVVIKSHDYITTPLSYTLQFLINDIEIYGSLALNYELGGLNPAVVTAAGKMGTKIVWMPTFSSKNDMQKKGIENKGITILNETGEILPVVSEILEIIKQYDMTLATGHLSTHETFKLLDEAKRVGISRTIASHPMSQSLGAAASVEDQKKMVRDGVFIEHCFIVTMPTSDRLDPQKMGEAIRTVGPQNCIMSTDFGQISNPPPVEGLRMFIETMLSCGITEDEIIMMVRVNPARALGLSQK